MIEESDLARSNKTMNHKSSKRSTNPYVALDTAQTAVYELNLDK
eukprot:CAMPEP_0185597372 /NCGR_PEP_ID=MMETSP0434-20130131/81327_1 /TAXON_ID=626734 ORGANISM="Favella taraikaensis, Strain Fe Narragansett Bay" /NCGR_SAMPLE_ID=MMETSP0434 /ASSEMBLY_ACC=CAM_ASM_000379 /LENGTH=43 /DNA_ID= /DNA_START= /DNA_END= /DNA_ORIENTATION=